MARRNVRLDHRGIGEILTSQPEVVAEIARLGAAVEAHVAAHSAVQRHGMTVDATQTTTDRTKVYVTIRHAGGRGVQAKYGVLTQAAAAQGLEVREQ